jgi:putative ABC transport system permease protein
MTAWGNHFKVAWRQIRRKPMLSMLKIVGLGLGIAASLLLIRYITWQWNFDRFHEHGKNIVRIQNDHYRDGILSSRSAMTYSGVPVSAAFYLPAYFHPLSR